MEKELADIGRQLQDKVHKERRLIRELEAELYSADVETQSEIERIKAAHLQRRREMMASLGGLARCLGTGPTRQMEDHRAGAIGQDGVRRIAQERVGSESLETITDYTRDLRARG